MCERSEPFQSLPHPGDVDDSAYEEERLSGGKAVVPVVEGGKPMEHGL